MGKTLWKFMEMPTCCEVCGYDKHFELCHIKSVSSFDNNTPIKVVNNLNNLIALCPNCHWEFDHNLMDEKEKLTIYKILEMR